MTDIYIPSSADRLDRSTNYWWDFREFEKRKGFRPNGLVAETVAPPAFNPNDFFVCMGATYHFIMGATGATLLARLPDGCKDPCTVTREVLELREQLSPARQKFNSVEKGIYDSRTSIKSLRENLVAINADAEAFRTRLDTPLAERICIRWFLDHFSFVANALLKRDVELDDILAAVVDLIPVARRRLAVRRPSKLYGLAMEAATMSEYSTLLQKKLGFFR